ncbi:MAG: phosphodiester glycosidase family protein [Treponema sp.]|nr:phosphodiester glycosidase family protein [Treponema sp.]
MKKSPLFFAFITFCLFSCVSAPKRTDLFGEPGGFVWQSVLGENGPVEGLDLFEGIFSGPALEFWAIRADLSNPDIEVLAGPLPENGTIRAVTVSTFARNYGCTAAINANPFKIPGKKDLSRNETTRGETTQAETTRTVGLVVSGGVMVSPPNPRYDALAFYGPEDARNAGQASVPDRAAADRALAGRAVVISQAEAFSPSGSRSGMIETAAGGFYRILEGGKPSAQALSERGGVRHPRSAAGVSADGRFLYLLVIDGRRPGSAGATEAETALIMERLGAADALCFDGGGSSALVLRQNGGRVNVLNTPAQILGRERPVTACFGIRVRSN